MFKLAVAALAAGVAALGLYFGTGNPVFLLVSIVCVGVAALTGKLWP